MAKIPQKDPLDTLNTKLILNELRPYLGLSMIGHECRRYLQLYHYWAYNDWIDARVKRLFGFGHIMEPVMRADLEGLGIMFRKNDQLELIGIGGHWKGHIDDDAFYVDSPEEPFLVEYKTHNEKNFKNVRKLKVRIGEPKHYDQMTAYMGYGALSKALYIAYNKNTSAYYHEWVEFDEDHFKELERKQMDVIMSDNLLPRIGNNSRNWFKCKMCNAAGVCFGDRPAEENCRTCDHVDVLDKGMWSCRITEKRLSVGAQRKGCSDWELAEILQKENLDV